MIECRPLIHGEGGKTVPPLVQHHSYDELQCKVGKGVENGKMAGQYSGKFHECIPNIKVM